jgi:hypothetical protein
MHPRPMIGPSLQVLKKLSRQHLVSQLLPVVTSLKHTLEAAHSSVQRAVMEYLVFLVKNSKHEVDQALSNDPCLRSEIEYDLKQYQKSLDSQTNSVTPRQGALSATKQKQTPASAPGSPSSVYSTRKTLDPQIQSVSKPSLKKSVGINLSGAKEFPGTPASHYSARNMNTPRTPKQALIALGKSSAIRAAEIDPEDENGNDLADRLASFQTHAVSRRYVL